MFLKKSLLGGIALSALTGAAALAGPDDGTLNMAFSFPIEGIDEVYDPKPETDFSASAVFNNLAAYDPNTGTYSGVLASDFTPVDDVTWDIALREGITFHDGSAFNAEDVAYTLNFLVDPEARFPSKARYSFIDNAEVVDDYTVRVHLNRPYAAIMARFATGMPMYPSDLHGALEDKALWGKTPVGTGPYRAVEVSSETGLVLERYEDYTVGDKPEIERIVIRPIPDAQSQIAELLTGGIDIFAASSSDVITSVDGMPGVTTTVSEDLSFLYVMIDAAGRSGNTPLTDLKVRQAIAHAINREEIRTNLTGARDEAPAMDRLCFARQVDCPAGGSPASYDPDTARALLSEAGYGDGFDLTITTTSNMQQFADAVAGYLRAVGIRAGVKTETIGAYRKSRADGALEVTVMFFTHAGMPDAGYSPTFYFGNASSDYTGDPRFADMALRADSEAGETRLATLTELYDLMDSEAVLFPLSANPIVFIHNEGVALDKTDRGGLLNPYGISAHNVAWSE
ncbi:ABC transporter substrate-binding protein [Sinisalibacter aestuarii]|uniref:ABC transporter substrate-binding protein n=1 Tax=Sinisalibacter aestuarii TaxID=2949426 RepID=A0ABQ5LYA2_9RHOB|nr:ABC transporter substrate-binding protein [Sinisalibacter aestuarii]GKY89937.1 ABC transporter substrate-binding protein [Sinisalibacter aestuarii]